MRERHEWTSADDLEEPFVDGLDRHIHRVSRWAGIVALALGFLGAGALLVVLATG